MRSDRTFAVLKIFEPRRPITPQVLRRIYTVSNVAALAVLAALCSCGGRAEPGPNPGPGMCGNTTEQPSRGAMHVDGVPIQYVDSPPSSGNHRSDWARWGEYVSIEPARWLHNLEHGGVAFLFSDTAPQTAIDALRTYAKSRGPDDGGAFRYVLAPYPGLPKPIALVAWTRTYLGDEVCAEDLDAFLAAYYRRATEDIASDGFFMDGWIGR